jgi:Zinc knuckle
MSIEKDYHSTIIKSLPPHLSAFVSNLHAGAKLYSSTKTIDPDELITLTSEQYECHAAQCACRNASNSSKGTKKDEALLVASNGKGGRTPHKAPGTCWNCGDKGHFKNKCPKPAKVANNKKYHSLNNSGSANAAVESDSESEAAFLAVDLNDDDQEMPPLAYVSDSDSDPDDEGGNAADDDSSQR